MFWKYNNSSPSQIESILNKENVTLKEIMDEEDIINECKVQTKALIDYLSKPEIMQELVNLTTTEPSPDLEERVRFKYPNIACELLTCDVPALNERLAGDKELLAKLYNFLDSEDPLNPLLASFFSKIMGVLITKKTDQQWLSYQFTCLQVLDFLKAKENLITLLLNHLGTSAIMDLVLKLMTQVEEGVERQNMLNWLDSQRIIQSLVALFNPKIDKERHYNVAQLLCDFIKMARDNQQSSMERNDPDPLLNTLESPDTVSLLLDEILNGDKCESAIVGGIQVLLALLDVNKTSIPKYESQNIYSTTGSYDENIDVEHKQRVMQSTTKVILKRLKDFHNLLLDPPQKKPISTTFGVLEPPLGNTRLQIIKLIASIILTNDMEALQELFKLETFRVLLDLFFKFPWNNFLHTQVQMCILSALKVNVDTEKGDSNALYEHLIVNCKLIDRILDAWKKNDETEAQDGIRQGYMGHLISIANGLVDLCSNTSLGQYLRDALPEVADAFKAFQETSLAETNKTQEILLGGVHPNSATDSNDEFNEMPYVPAGVSPQQMFVHYQMQHIASKFPETFGFNDNDFNDGDDVLPTAMNFDLSNDDMISKSELFKQVCAQSINTLGLDDDDDQIFEERDQTFQTVIEKTSKRHNTVYGSDSDDDSQSSPAEPTANADPWSSPKEAAEAPPTDPWSTSQFPNENSSGWADFSTASFVAFDDHENRIEMKTDEPVEVKDAAAIVEDKSEVKSNKAEEMESNETQKKEVAAGDQGEGSRPSSSDKTVQLPSLVLEGDSATALIDVNSKDMTKSDDVPDDKNSV